MQYHHRLEKIADPLPLLADYPDFVEPLRYEDRYLATPVVNEPDGDLTVRAWRYWYNVRGIVEMENRLEAKATAIIMVHPWGIDDGHGLLTPEPAGCAFFCTPEKNQVCTRHIEQVVNPFLRRLRSHVGLVACSMPLVEDDIRRLLYASIDTPPEKLQPETGKRRLQKLLQSHSFTGKALKDTIEFCPELPVRSYMEQTPSTDARTGYNGKGFWALPMPVHAALDRHRADLVFYDGEGYEKVRDYLHSRNIRHVLLTGYATDMCVISTTCGYDNLSRDFNLFLVGDATMATFPGSTTPRFATQVALHNAALRQLVTQVSWIR